MTEPLTPPKRKNPLARTRRPQLPPSARSRTAHGLTAAAAEGRFALQVCAGCGTVVYPPRDACPSCLSPRLPFEDVNPHGTLVAQTTVHVSTDNYFRERQPWPVGLVKLDVGPAVVAHLHGDVAEGSRVRLMAALDRGGAAVMMALPDKDKVNMSDDPELREFTCDPKFRRVLITDGRSEAGQALARACSNAGASLILVGVADPWKPFPGEAALRATDAVEIVPLDLTDTESVAELAAQDGARTDILINTAAHVRAGGMLDHASLRLAREELELRYLGLIRLAQAFGPVMRTRGADGINAAAAFVNLLSIHAMAAWPAYGVFSSVEAACLSAAQTLRSELRPGGVKVVNVFSGPLETEWFQTVPPPKVAPSALAKAVISALQTGVEDVFVGDVAQDIKARLAVNPKALERELGE
jgi:NAD(P)-dependent dehydrogenase (short-subunit alcohol dehydrogenase family)/uncharacterized OB-fold protein